jgi:hypothetical protein
MGAPVLLFVAIYLIFVGARGNGEELYGKAKDDAQGFVPWIAAWLFLMLLQKTRAQPLVTPFITLAMVTAIVSNWSNVRDDVKSSYNILRGAK